MSLFVVAPGVWSVCTPSRLVPEVVLYGWVTLGAAAANSLYLSVGQEDGGCITVVTAKTQGCSVTEPGHATQLEGHHMTSS